MALQRLSFSPPSLVAPLPQSYEWCLISLGRSGLMVATDVGELAVVSVRPALTLPSAVVEKEVVILLVEVMRDSNLMRAMLFVGIVPTRPKIMVSSETLFAHHFSHSFRHSDHSSSSVALNSCLPHSLQVRTWTRPKLVNTQTWMCSPAARPCQCVRPGIVTTSPLRLRLR